MESFVRKRQNCGGKQVRPAARFTKYICKNLAQTRIFHIYAESNDGFAFFSFFFFFFKPGPVLLLMEMCEKLKMNKISIISIVIHDSIIDIHNCSCVTMGTQDFIVDIHNCIMGSHNFLMKL